MMNRIVKVNKYMNSIDFSKLWPGFKKTNFAIYDEESAYFNDDYDIDIDLSKEGSVFVGKVDNRFAGCTAIKINNHQVAIWDANYISKDMTNKKLTSMIIHEMFHCFQLDNKYEKEFPNEILGMDYPITIENINLRCLERECLFRWISEENKEKKLDLVNKYFTFRQERENLIGDFIKYEKSLESLEGTAYYAEFKALLQLHPNDEKLITEDFFKGFNEINEENIKIRPSTLVQGAILSLIADEYLSNWKEIFQKSNTQLSDFLKDNMEIGEKNIDSRKISFHKLEKVIYAREEKINKLFNDFDSSKENILEEDIQIVLFDPMNIVKRNNESIHKSFIKVKIDGKERMIKGPVKVTQGNSFFDVKKIEW